MASAGMLRRTSGYIAGPWVDAFFLIGAPLVGIAVFVPFGMNPTVFYPISDFHFGGFVADGFITAVIFAHLGLVFFRSHLNGVIFRKHRFRFVGAPIVSRAQIRNEPGCDALSSELTSIRAVVLSIVIRGESNEHYWKISEI